MKRFYTIVFVKKWFKNEEGIAAIEAALLFPILLMLLIGVFDFANGVLANQKTIRASQITADLITRNVIVDGTEIQEAYRAGELAMQPFDTETYGVDIVSFSFDRDAVAQIVWRETINMDPVDDALGLVADLAEANSGVVMVVSTYQYQPRFGRFIIDTVNMQEQAFLSGRRSSVVNRE